MNQNMNRYLVGGVLGACFFTLAGVSAADSLKISIGIRENNVPGPIFGDGGGSGNGIESINRDGQTLTADGTWQLFTFAPATDPKLAFAGTTANSMLEPGHEWAVLEHIRILNDDGITSPIRLWIDDLTNTVAAGSVVQDFEAEALGAEVMFQEPRFSGSTSGNLIPGTTSVVSSSAAFSGSQSLQADFQFIDNDPTRWIRWSTFGSAGDPGQRNPIVRIIEPGGPAPTISFYAMARVVPEPASLLLLGLAGVALSFTRRRN